MQDFNDMLYFAEVVEKGGFAAAGRSLGLPKSRLSRRIAQLEARLGVRLLQRTTRKLSLTEAGALYHRHCLAMRDEADAAADAVAQVQTEPRGTIRIACPITLAQTTVGELVPLFLARHPKVRIDMRVANRPVNVVEEGFDVALRVRGTLDDSGSLVVKRLGTTRTVMVASPALLARHGPLAHPQDLAAVETMAMSAADGRAGWPLVGPGGAEYMLWHKPRYVADDLHTLKVAALAGAGVSLLPDYMARAELKQGLLVPAVPGWAPREGVVHAVFPSRRGLVPAVRSLLDFLGENMAGDERAISKQETSRLN